MIRGRLLRSRGDRVCYIYQSILNDVLLIVIVIVFSIIAACALCIPVVGGALNPESRDILLQFAVKTLQMKYYDVYIWRYAPRELIRKEILGLLSLIVQQMR